MMIEVAICSVNARISQKNEREAGGEAIDRKEFHLDIDISLELSEHDGL